MTEVRMCPQCQSELPAEVADGQCPHCRLQQAETVSGVAALPGGSDSQPHDRSLTPPSKAELALHFPLLEILELIGQGGMGTVYKARQPKLDRLVALKFLQPDPGNPGFAERFTREARALARLNHPNIITIHDFGEAGGLYYFLMEYVDGANLRQWSKAAQPGPMQVLKIVSQICDGLQFAHDEGIVHRDIKPENILIDKRGRLKIADFGIAKLLGHKTVDFTLTGPWQVVGTLNYMAPEQVDNPQEVNHRADIYALGVVAYEMLTGQLPKGKFPLPSEKAPVDPAVDAVVLRALEGDPEKRYQKVGDFKAALESLPKRTNTAPLEVSTTLAFNSNDPSQPIPAPSILPVLLKPVVKTPAVGLMMTGIISFVPLLFYLLLIVEDKGYNPEYIQISPIRLLMVLSGLIGIVIFMSGRVLLTLGHSARAKQPQWRLRRVLAITGSILAICPVHLGWPLGLVMGSWGLRCLASAPNALSDDAENLRRAALLALRSIDPEAVKRAGGE
jgi:serine/threonine protein kinase